MPTSEDFEDAKKRAEALLGGTALAGPARRSQLAANSAVTSAFVDLLVQVDMHVPESREKSLAVTKIEEAKMWAVKAVFSESTDYAWKKN